ncbi:MAG TPA: MoxR family ATPase [Anaerolineales bacterium]|nr:MoxR family ATPase [Anaerolineales bacterium]
MNPAEVKLLYRAMCVQAERVLVGLQEPFEMMVVALLSGGHVLLEGVPGTAKTLMAKTLAHLVQADFRRVQFTPDLMPSDILGTNIFNLGKSQFELRKGPIFTHVLLGDEINRAPAKTQSALLEAMEEKQVNLDGERHLLPAPFMVIATQNPLEYEGTYPLPEAQLDRFLFKILIPYSPKSAELEVLNRYHAGFDAHDLVATGLQAVVSPERLAAAQTGIRAVTVEPGILNYILDLAHATRNSKDLTLGVSTRAAIWMLLASKTLAAINGRAYVIPDDIKTVFMPAARHRVVLKPEAEIEGLTADTILRRVLGQVDVPR